MKGSIQNLDVKNIFFIALVVISGLFALGLFSPYINIIIFSVVIVQIFHPMYRFILRVTKSPSFSTFLTVLITILLVVVSITLISLLTFSELRNFSRADNIISMLQNIQVSINDGIVNLNGLIRNINPNYTIQPLDLATLALSIAQSLEAQLLPLTSQILSLSGNIIFAVFLLLLCLIYLFPIYDRLPSILSSISPLEDSITKLLFQKFRETTKGVIRGSLVISVLQATAVIIPFLILGVGSPVLLWLLMVILSILPIGSGLVWAPVGVAFIIDGLRRADTFQVLTGVFVIVYSAIIINVIETVLRPRFLEASSRIHPLAAIFSVLGGIAFFGPLGLLYGPLIYVLYITVIEVYREKFLKNDKETDKKSN